MFCGMLAQSYEKQWKAIDEARRNDLPRTAIEGIDRIYLQAVREGKDAQILRALITRHTLVADISKDSVPAAKQRIEAALAGETRPEMQALWHSALGLLYAQSAFRDTLAQSKSKAHFAASLNNIEALGAAKASDYVPALAIGKNSETFGGDLLHVVARATKQCGATEVREYYKNKNMQGAVLLLRLDSLKSNIEWQNLSLTQRDDFKTLMAWKKQYEDCSENIHTYIALSNLPTQTEADDSLLVSLLEEGLAKYKKSPFKSHLLQALARLKQSSISLSSGDRLLVPNADICLKVQHQAIKRAEIRLYHDKARIAKYPLTMSKQPDYAMVTDSLIIRVAEPGIYRAELRIDGKKADEAKFHVNRVMPVFQPINKDLHRIAAVDLVSGEPYKTASLLVCDRENGQTVATYKSNKEGYILVESKAVHNYDLFLQTPTDQFAPAFRITGNWFNPGSAPAVSTQIRLFTDRGIYRPGQTLHYGGFIYTQNGDVTAVKTGEKLVVQLVGMEGKALATDTVFSDEMGNIHGSFTLPVHTLNGYFSLKANGRWLSQFRIEEYKRPTFSVEFESPKEGYKAGDTLVVKGSARTYNGLPVDGASVRFHVINGECLADSVTTDEAGSFETRVVLTTEKDFLLFRSYIRRSTSIEAAVTAENGETQMGTQQFFFANRAAHLNAGWKNTICKEEAQKVFVGLVNPSGTALEADGYYNVYKGKALVAKGSFRTNTEFVPTELLKLPSGEYTLSTHVDLGNEAIDSLTDKITLFSERDVRPAGHAPLWLYSRSNARGDSTMVLVGSSLENAWITCDIYAGERLLESKYLCLNDSIVKIDFNLLPQYGEAASILFTLVRNGMVYTERTQVTQPTPEKSLQLRWKTFRSTLQPGQGETWQLEVKTPDGKPADAAVMATLYDASLDAFERNDWFLNINYWRHIPYVSVQNAASATLNLSKTFSFKQYKLNNLQLSRWADDLFTLYGEAELTMPVYKSTVALNTMKQVYARSEEAKPKMADGLAESLRTDATASGNGAETAVRKNFAETAFFMPALRTDGSGIVSISFTLPESLTAWNFRALAHTADMHHGKLDTTVVAKKEFMASLALPRFLSKGDRIVLPATLRNLTAKDIDGQLTLILEDAQTGKALDTRKQAFTIGADATAVYEFKVEAPKNAEVVICRLLADGKSFSDGEEHLLPILSDRVLVTKTLDIGTADGFIQNVRIDTLWSKSKNMANRTLTVEITGNPLWNFLADLPNHNASSPKSATDWAMQLYIATMMRQFGNTYPAVAEEVRLRAEDGEQSEWHGQLSRNPELKAVLLEETPWLCEAEDEEERYAHLAELLDTAAQRANIANCLKQLKALQTGDGGWSWMRGMQANQNTTLEVATLLARIELQHPSAEGSEMLKKATAYLEKQAEDEKKIHALDYLYFRIFLTKDGNSKKSKDKAIEENCKKLLQGLKKQSVTESMAQKARRAVVLFVNGETEAADIAVKSLIEHTTLLKGKRFFDTPRAGNHYAIVRSHLAILEALNLASDKGNNQKETGELMNHLIATGHTEVWNMCYVLPDNLTRLMGDYLSDTGDSLPDYTYERYNDAKTLKKKKLNINLGHNPLATASVYAQYTLPAGEVEQSGNGMQLVRRIEVLKDKVWLPVNDKTSLRLGDRLRTVLEIKTDRAYDYVVLKSPHAAGLSPVRPLSGYNWQNGVGCYRAVGDCSTNFFFDHLEKGSAVLTEEFFLTHTGHFVINPATLSSLYAPEYRAGTKAGSIAVF